jgi:dienelactone hydrolase
MKKYFLILIPAVLFVFLSGCSPQPGETEFISGAKRRSQKAVEFVTGNTSIVYTVPQMATVQVKTNVPYGNGESMDLYYPPDFEFEEDLPVVVIAVNISNLRAKDMGRAIDWGLLMAAHGIIAVAYEPRYAEQGLPTVLEYLSDHSGELGIDKTRIGIMGHCGACWLGAHAMTMKEKSYYEGLRVGAFLYGQVGWSEDIAPEASLLLLKPGREVADEVKRSIDTFAECCRTADRHIRLIDYPEGSLAFDVTEDPRQEWEYMTNASYAADREMVKEVLEFILEEMGV